MRQKIVFVFLILILVSLFSFMLYDFKEKKQKKIQESQLPKTSINRPLTSVSGRVTSVSNNTVKIEVYKSVYQVEFSKETSIHRLQPPIPYLLKPVSADPPSPFTIQDIHVGDTIEVHFASDPNIPKEKKISAISVYLPEIHISITGKIISKKGSLLRVEPSNTFTDTNLTPRIKQYKITTVNDTEISQPLPNPNNLIPPPAKRLSLEDLPIDSLIVIYTKEDVIANTELTALHIEPFTPPKTTLP